MSEPVEYKYLPEEVLDNASEILDMSMILEKLKSENYSRMAIAIQEAKIDKGLTYNEMAEGMDSAYSVASIRKACTPSAPAESRVAIKTQLDILEYLLTP